jgi:hypothetical protein
MRFERVWRGTKTMTNFIKETKSGNIATLGEGRKIRLDKKFIVR